jgi:uncharacterized protein (TIGR00725 family)
VETATSRSTRRAPWRSWQRSSANRGDDASAASTDGPRRRALSAAYVAVVGASDATPRELDVAEELGRLLARAGAVVVCGGLGGVMHAAARGCASEAGVSVGILPGDDRAAGSPHLTIRVATGLGEARNVIVARAADAVIAIGGEFGTLSEIAFALKMGKRVIGLGTWALDLEGLPGDPMQRASDAADAVDRALVAAERLPTETR